MLASYLVARLRAAGLFVDRGFVEQVTIQAYLRPEAAVRPHPRARPGYTALARAWSGRAFRPPRDAKRRAVNRKRVTAIERLDLALLYAAWQATQPAGRNGLSVELWPGRPYPLGAHYDGMGANFAVYAGEADAVELCLFDDDGAETRLELPEMHGHVWHGYLPFVETGQLYGFRAHGPYDEGQGQLYNPNKLLLDPYARAITGTMIYDERLLPYTSGDPTTPSALDSAPATMRSVLVNPYYDWGNDHRPEVPVADSVIYEVHVKGATARHPERARGAAGHLPRPRPPGVRRAPHQAGRDRGGAAARPRARRASRSSSARASPTTGATTPSASSLRTTPTQPATRAPARCRSSARW